MTDADAAALMREGLMVMVRLGGPPLLVMLAAGLLLAVFQAVTQINEATLVFLPKVLALGVTLVILGPFMFDTLRAYTRLLIDRMVMQT